jgi:hypothetical protein
MLEGYKVCPKWLKESYKKAVKFYCEYCHVKNESSNLEVHRIRRGINGGLYVPHNVKVICKRCHFNTHFQENR